ncbi:unnamed protein product [Rotaria sp. Silwood2]|nr:unnamed protein product [Rotaria sp. Silwood2]CAF2875447.1 unnamed protein product [Rotaria sp. Silwood2]CAF3134948.1 unnamed protein product [Rotaria sp. Silwood2]CAF4015255.1 unnamed protein product [Rotaria sp. Silwood2]CAF4104877.1 unnamed protein product [Rotaria sp. Silwood2]
MSSVSIILIILINNIYQTLAITQCNLLNPIDLQAAAYNHSLILRVQPIYSSETIEKTIVISEVLVREVIKISTNSYHKIKMNDLILIRIDNNIDEILDDSCWYLLRITTVDIILFLNETNTNEFDLRFPPVESTLYVRHNIDAVINYETYSPRVIIKTQIDKPVLENSYSLQCNVRGNPLPRLFWSKYNQTLEYYPSTTQCKTSCRIYSNQNEYESILYFQTLTIDDSGIYVCHAENAINYTMTSVYIDVDQTNIINRSNINVTCAILKYCHHRGQCVNVNNQWKCLCDNRYIGNECETNYDDIIKKQNNDILLFKSRLLTSGILILIGFVIILIAIISYFYARHKKIKQKKCSTSKRIINGKILESQLIEPINKPEIQQSLSIPIVRIINNRSILMKESTTTTTTDNDNNEYKNSNGFCSLTKTNEECFPLNMNNTEESNFQSSRNGLILSKGYLEFYQPDAQSGLIRPLTIRTNTPNHYKKKISSHHRFLLSRSLDQ